LASLKKNVTSKKYLLGIPAEVLREIKNNAQPFNKRKFDFDVLFLGYPTSN